MKRYVFLAGAVCLLLSAFSRSLNMVLYVAVFLLSAFLFGYFLAAAKTAKGIAVCMVVIAVFSFVVLNTVNKIKTVKDADGKMVYFSAVVCASEESRATGVARTCTLKIISSKNTVLGKGDKVLLYYDAPDNFELGTRIDGEFVITAMDESDFSFISTGINCFVSARNVRFSDSGIFIYSFAGKIQNFIKDTLLENTDNSGLLIGMLYGERGFISDKLLDYVRVCGASHILVVSGLHFSVICGGFKKLCNAIAKSQKLKDLLFVIFVFCFCLICGFSVSVLRVASIYLLLILYRRLNRSHDNLVGFCDALLVVLFIHPAAFHSVSFQLSFASVFGILVLYPFLSKAIYFRFANKPILSYILKTAAVTLSATVMTFPTSVYYFGWISLVSLPVNLLVGLAVTVLLVSAAIGVVLFALKLKLLTCCAFFVSDALADYFTKIVRFFAELPYSRVVFKNTGLLTVLVIVLYFSVYLLYTCKRRPDLVKSYKEMLIRKKEE